MKFYNPFKYQIYKKDGSYYVSKIILFGRRFLSEYNYGNFYLPETMPYIGRYTFSNLETAKRVLSQASEIERQTKSYNKDRKLAAQFRKV